MDEDDIDRRNRSRLSNPNGILGRIHEGFHKRDTSYLRKIGPPSRNAIPARTYDAASVAEKRVGIILTGGNVDLDMLPWK